MDGADLMTAPATATASAAPPGETPHDVPLYIYRGDSRSWAFRLWVDTDATEPYDLAQVTAVAAQIRRSPDDRSSVDLTCAIVLPNYVFVHLSAGQSQVTPSGRWDMQLTFPGPRVQTVIKGAVTVEPDVTR
jgi:hypothetical protein